MNTFIGEWLVIEGENHIMTCRWEYIKNRRGDVVRKMLQRAGTPMKIFYEKAEANRGYLNQSYPDSNPHYKSLERRYYNLSDIEFMLSSK